jgi:predicted permease
MLRQLLTESLLLGVIGAALGLALGSLALSLAPVILPDGLLPGSVVLQFDLRLVGFCLLAALLTALIFGFVPAWQASGLSPARVIGADSRSSVSGGGRLREMLVVGQVATAVALLFAGGLLLRTLLELEAAERGYGADGVLTMLVDPLGSQYPTPTDLLRFYDEVGRQVNALPEVASSAWATTVPLGVSTLGGVFISTTGTMVSDPMQRPVADYQIVSEDYFRTVDVAILAGRAFDQRDAGDSVPVAIVSEAFVRKYLRDDGRADVAALQGVIGRLVGVQTSNAADAPVTQREIIGVARQVKRRPDEPDAAAQLYVPLAQRPIGETFLLVRSRAGDPAALASTVQDTIRGVDTGQLVSLRNVVTLEEVAADATARHRFRAVLIGGFSTLVLVLAATGVFGVLAYAVQQRRRDLGLRMALGAAPRAVVRMVARSALRLLLVGAAIGLLVALVLGQLLGSMLFGVEPFDLTTLLLVGLLLAVSAAIATLVPAWRAAQVDPAVTLRGE